MNQTWTSLDFAICRFW